MGIHSTAPTLQRTASITLTTHTHTYELAHKQAIIALHHNAAHLPSSILDSVDSAQDWPDSMLTARDTTEETTLPVANRNFFVWPANPCAPGATLLCSTPPSAKYGSTAVATGVARVATLLAPGYGEDDEQLDVMPSAERDFAGQPNSAGLPS